MAANFLPSGFFGLSQPKDPGMSLPDTQDISALLPKPTLGDKLYALGGLLLNYSGHPNDAAKEFSQYQQYRQLAPYQAALQQRQRAQQFADAIGLYDYKRQNPGPDEITQRYQALNQIKPGLGDTYVTNYSANGGASLPQITTIPGVGTFAIPRTPASATSSIPDAAVSYLRSNPNTAALFDQKYGAGASQRYLTGGAASQGAATFP